MRRSRPPEEEEEEEQPEEKEEYSQQNKNPIFGQTSIVNNSNFPLSESTFKAGCYNGVTTTPPALILSSKGWNLKGFLGLNGLHQGS